VYPQGHGYPLASCSRVIEIAEDLRVPVVLPCRMIMTWNLPSLSMGEMLSVVQANRRVPFVVSGVNYEAMTLLSMKKKPENLYIETSCLQMWGATELLLEELGPERVLLGTGTPVQYAQSGTKNILDSRLTQKQKERVAASNARTLFRL
jgi:predicted TIM-barrel fold metal-dependent hydrolase